MRDQKTEINYHPFDFVEKLKGTEALSEFLPPVVSTPISFSSILSSCTVALGEMASGSCDLHWRCMAYAIAPILTKPQVAYAIFKLGDSRTCQDLTAPPAKILLPLLRKHHLQRSPLTMPLEKVWSIRGARTTSSCVRDLVDHGAYQR